MPDPQHYNYDKTSSSESLLRWNPAEQYKDIKIAEEYDDVRFSSLSGRVFNSLEKYYVRKAFSKIPANSLILDAPCGTGRLAETLLELGHRVVGADISPAMLEVASRRLSRFGDRFQTRVKDAREFCDEEEQFDAALCARVLMHFPLNEQITFLHGVASVTRGTVVFNQSVNTSYNALRRSLKRRLKHQASARFPITLAESRTLVSEAGLKLDKKFWLLFGVSEAAFFVCH